MSNNPYENIVPTETSQLPDNDPYSTTKMNTVVGVTKVANNSFDIQGNPVSSKNDTPIDINALQGTVVTKESLVIPSTDYVKTALASKNQPNANVQKQHTELEIRFSEVVKNDLFETKTPAKKDVQPRNWAFRPIVLPNTFNRIKKTFETYGLQFEKTSSVDTFYKIQNKSVSKQKELRSQPETLRHTLSTNVQTGQLTTSWMTKRKTKPVDIWDINVRISFSSEIELNRTTAPHNAPFMVRRKERTSFFDWCCRYDLTEIVTETMPLNTSNTSNAPKKDKTYEIEIEFLPEVVTQNDVDAATNHVEACILHMLRLIQDSPSVITLSEKHNVLLEYSILSKCFDLPKPRFVGAQPETLHRRHLPLVKRKGIYSITEKYDGERYLLFISDNGNSYIIGRNMKVKSTGLSNRTDKGSILDVEYVNNILFAFDILFHKGMDIRGKIEYLLEDRLELVNLIMDNFMKQNVRNEYCIPVFIKDYVFTNFDGTINAFIENSYEDGIVRDGFIFTPVKEYYPIKPKWPTLLKWKPPEMNTIDFHIKRSDGDGDGDGDGHIWNIFVGSSLQNKDHVLVPFDPIPRMQISNKDLSKFLDIERDTVVTMVDLGVIECAWDFEQKKFIPMRRRKDKIVPNFITVAMDVWESLSNPVRVTDLQAKSFVHMRKFHNVIKKHLIENSIEMATVVHKPPGSWADMADEDDENGQESNEVKEDDTKNLTILDMACGRGGDLWKWAFHCPNLNSLTYVGLDIDDDLLSEAERRSRHVKKRYNNCNLDFSFHKCDLRQGCLPDLKNQRFDVVSCQFALHYFYESMETFTYFITSVKSHIKEKGTFIATLFDGQQVYDLCSRKENIQDKTGESGGFKIVPLFNEKEPLESIKKREFGIAIEAVLQGDDEVILKDATKEYVVFADLFVKRMLQNGFVMTKSSLFRNVLSQNEDGTNSNMSPIEQLYSSLHRYYIFTYIGKENDNDGEYVPEYVWKPALETKELIWKHQQETSKCKKKKSKKEQISDREKWYRDIGDVFKRCCNEKTETRELCGSAMECMTTMLENITGMLQQQDGRSMERKRVDGQDEFDSIDTLSRRHKINIHIIEESNNGCHIVTHMGNTDDGKRNLYFWKDTGNDGHHYQLLAHSTETSRYEIFF